MNSGLARTLYFAAQAARGEPVRSVLGELEESQYWPAERLAARQWELQLALLKYAAATVPWYRERWSRAGVEVADIRVPEDWSRLPILEKHDLRDSGSRLLSTRRLASYRASTSGSSGTPLSVLRSQRSWAHAHANVFRGWSWHGLGIGERYAYLWGMPLRGRMRAVAWIRDALFNRIRGSAFHLGPDGSRALFARLLRDPVKFAVGYPSAFRRFAHELHALGLDGRQLGWRAVVCTAEMLGEAQRQDIAAAFGARVVDSYGCAEAGVTGFECERGGMHVPVESVLVERIAGAEGADGPAEILLTDLHNFSQPLIRYRVGDLANGVAAAACPCGRALPLLGKLEGRSGEWIRLPNGRQLNPHLLTYLFKPFSHGDEVREYQFVQFSSDRVEVRVIAGSGWSSRVADELHSRIQAEFGFEVPVRVVTTLVRRGRGKHTDFVRAEDAGP